MAYSIIEYNYDDDSNDDENNALDPESSLIKTDSLGLRIN